MRLDSALVARGLARSRKHAVELIAAGGVRVNGRAARKASDDIGPDDRIDAASDHYVSRAAHKLLGALDASGTEVRGRALDAGASTGGFTQVLLERGCDVVYAVDVGHDQLAGSVRDDPRVVVRERLNLRDLTLEHLDDEPVDVVVADVSFISLKLLMPALLGVLRPDGVALLMVKPQFEVGRAGLDDHGIVVDPALQVAAVDGVVASAEALGFTCDWRGESPLPGTTGNREFFVRLRRR
ncbi:TlyA family RNA methyltransferase [Propioniciclava tarda]|uniref:TlyA family RNA methyltransferase n=1 Tax=Propioniciclava tarda TaxID=433330 RepID=A0A4V2JT85_PROTD|nr:TlyA family RNA methyltransferase [Propioniciclava tarda]TBT95241.1 TlyA family RNA methyltransferase [Propioniciclava tarda]SMO53017.1 23S rRNA (cytidine1920-2'-O)/16S rRNA (cytidine1409-2'-O)-methyltransferase [Propioniciclava tarda]HQA31280.1 TlyA family RNA methyltransferase [Propioniciclava tarda]